MSSTTSSSSSSSSSSRHLTTRRRRVTTAAPRQRGHRRTVSEALDQRPSLLAGTSVAQSPFASLFGARPPRRSTLTTTPRTDDVEKETRLRDTPDQDRLRKARRKHFDDIPPDKKKRRKRAHTDSKMAYLRTDRRDVGSGSRRKKYSNGGHRDADRDRNDDTVYVYTRPRVSREDSDDRRSRRSRATTERRATPGEFDDRRRRSRGTEVFVEGDGDAIEVIRETRTRTPRSSRRSDTSPLARPTSGRDTRPLNPTRSRANTMRRDTPVTSSSRTAVDSPVVASRQMNYPPRDRRRSMGGGFFSLFRGNNSAPSPEKYVECVICMSEDIPLVKSARLGCGHRMCHSCLKRLFTMSVNDPAHMPPRCCTNDVIPLRHVERLFNDRFKTLWNKKYQEFTASNRLYCPARGCGEWIKPSHIYTDRHTGRKYGVCKRCKARVCALCGNKWHGRRECPSDEDTRRFAEVARESGWQRCFNCKAMVELKEGCNHMTCRCNAEFCMVCGAEWKTCSCPWFNHTQTDADDVLQMNLPVDGRVPYDRPPSPPLPPHGIPSRLSRRAPSPPPAAPGPPRRRPLPPEVEDRLASRRAQEQADAEYARNLEYDSDASSGRGTRRPQSAYRRRETPTPVRRETYSRRDRRAPQRHSIQVDGSAMDGVDDHVYGVGNSGAHHLNETFRPRTAGNDDVVEVITSTRNRRGEPVTRRRESRPTSWFGGVMRTLSGKSRPKEPRRVGAGEMAGMGYRGDERVGAWLRHVVNDPIAVEQGIEVETY